MTSDDHSSSSPGEKPAAAEVELVHTNEQVPGHPDYYEKGGLRTYGDNMDHDHEPPVSRPIQISIIVCDLKAYSALQMTFRRIMSLVAMAFLWTGSQIPLYIFGRTVLLGGKISLTVL